MAIALAALAARGVARKALPAAARFARRTVFAKPTVKGLVKGALAFEVGKRAVGRFNPATKASKKPSTRPVGTLAAKIGGGVIGAKALSTLAPQLVKASPVAIPLAALAGGAAVGAIGGRLLGGREERRGVIGGTVVGSSGGVLLVDVGDRIVAVKKRQRRRFAPRARASRSDKLMELAMIKAISK